MQSDVAMYRVYHSCSILYNRYFRIFQIEANTILLLRTSCRMISSQVHALEQEVARENEVAGVDVQIVEFESLIGRGELSRGV